MQIIRVKIHGDREQVTPEGDFSSDVFGLYLYMSGNVTPEG